jgi:hypothetical protein
MFSNFFSENCAVYEIMPKNSVEPERQQTVCLACWISKAKQAQAYARAHTHPHARSYTHALNCARTQTHAHANTEVSNTYCFSTAAIVS